MTALHHTSICARRYRCALVSSRVGQSPTRDSFVARRQEADIGTLQKKLTEVATQYSDMQVASAQICTAVSAEGIATGFA